MPTPSQPLRVLLLPPIAWQPDRDAYRSGCGPDPFAVVERLATHGIEALLIDPGRRPLNPFAGRHSLLEGLDPLRALRTLVRYRNIDLAVAVFEGPALPLELLRGVFRWRVPVVLWDIGLTETWRLRERILDRVVPRVAGIFVLSANQQPYIAARWGRRDGVELLGHSVDTDFFAPAPQQPDGPILSIGEDAGRDFPCLLDVAPRIDTDIVIKTTTIPSSRPLPPRVTVQRERISYPALRDLYARSRFVVVPLRETLNASGVSSILEAGAMGRALIVSETAAMRDFIVPGETCLTVPCGDRAALQAAIQRLVAEPETCARLGENARRFMAATCAVPVFADRLAGLLRRYARPREAGAREMS